MAAFTLSSDQRHLLGWSRRCGSAIAAAGTRTHPAYGHGMTRSIDRTNGRHAGSGAPFRRAAVEAQTGHRFRSDLSMADIIAEAAGLPRERIAQPGALALF